MSTADWGHIFVLSQSISLVEKLDRAQMGKEPLGFLVIELLLWHKRTTGRNSSIDSTTCGFHHKTNTIAFRILFFLSNLDL